MKKIGSLCLAAIMAVSLFAGCAGSSSKIAKIEDMKGKALGTITWFGVEDDTLADMFEKTYGFELKSMKSFDTEASLVMALDSGKIDAAWVRDFQANIYTKDSDKYSAFTTDNDTKLAGSARMAAASDTDAAADLTKINDALTTLKDEGTLGELKKDYIDDFSFSKGFDSISMPVIEGAPTYKISVSGSMAPLDYIAADGEPTGYCIALLSKISEMAKINFDLVTVGIGTDRLELTSGKIDYIFCYTLTDDNMNNETELSFSDSYYSYSGTMFLVKK